MTASDVSYLFPNIRESVVSKVSKCNQLRNQFDRSDSLGKMIMVHAHAHTYTHSHPHAHAHTEDT